MSQVLFLDLSADHCLPGEEVFHSSLLCCAPYLLLARPQSLMAAFCSFAAPIMSKSGDEPPLLAFFAQLLIYSSPLTYPEGIQCENVCSICNASPCACFYRLGLVYFVE